MSYNFSCASDLQRQGGSSASKLDAIEPEVAHALAQEEGGGEVATSGQLGLGDRCAKATWTLAAEIAPLRFRARRHCCIKASCCSPRSWSARTCAPALAGGGLLPEYSAMELGVYAVYASRMTTKVRALVDFLAEAFRLSRRRA